MFNATSLEGIPRMNGIIEKIHADIINLGVYVGVHNATVDPKLRLGIAPTDLTFRLKALEIKVDDLLKKMEPFVKTVDLLDPTNKT